MNVGFLTARSGMASDERREFRQRFGRFAASDVEVTKHAIASGVVGHLCFGVCENFFGLIDVALREVNGSESGARRRIFRFELNGRFEFLAGVVGPLVVLVESSQVHSWDR